MDTFCWCTPSGRENAAAKLLLLLFFSSFTFSSLPVYIPKNSYHEINIYLRLP